MHIIATNGFKRAGKGALANAIEDNILVGNVKQVGFADKVKIFGARALGFLDRTDQELIDLMDDAKERWDIEALRLSEVTHEGAPPEVQIAAVSGRRYLQNVGTEARKLFGDDFWVDQVLPTPADSIYNPEALGDKHPGVDWLLITDLRFENEAQRVLDLGGEVWRVTRPGTESDGHASEQELPAKYVTREIDNSRDLDWLSVKAGEALYDLEAGIQ